MYVVTLLTDPSEPCLTQQDVDALVQAWQGREVRWLAEGEAAEFRTGIMPADQWAVWRELQAKRIDLAVQINNSRRKKLLLADMDSTMIQQECIDELAVEAGIGERVSDITARAMNGELNFEEALIERVGLLSGLPVSVIDRVYKERIQFTPGGAELVATMRGNGAHAALVSGGFTAFTSRVAAALGFDTNQANSLLEENGTLTGAVGMPILGKAAKVEALESLTAQLGISAADVLAVGDGANDLGMLGVAGMGVALHAKPSVAAQCDLRISFGDLTALLYLQGYTKDEFIQPQSLL
ncbi:MAG: phosphoserine phosphatase SerB [Mangrovicoccus sp.]